MNNQQIISKFGEINNISHKIINELSCNNITDNEVLKQTELIENKLIEIRLTIGNDDKDIYSIDIKEYNDILMTCGNGRFYKIAYNRGVFMGLLIGYVTACILLSIKYLL